MPRVKPRQTPNGKDYLEIWENEYKPLILTYFQVPLEVVAETLGISVTKVLAEFLCPCRLFCGRL